MHYLICTLADKVFLCTLGAFYFPTVPTYDV